MTVCRGAEAYGAAQSINGVILDLAGYGSQAVSIFNSALTLYRAYTDITGTAPISGSYEDFIQVKLNYDVWTKYTYADLGYEDGYRLGAVTQKVRLIDIEILQYYADCNGGREVAVCNILNKSAVTANFKKSGVGRHSKHQHAVRREDQREAVPPSHRLLIRPAGRGTFYRLNFAVMSDCKV